MSYTHFQGKGKHYIIIYPRANTNHQNFINPACYNNDYGTRNKFNFQLPITHDSRISHFLSYHTHILYRKQHTINLVKKSNILRSEHRLGTGMKY